MSIELVKTHNAGILNGEIQVWPCLKINCAIRERY